jgi:ubiquitin-like protein Pup
MTVGGVEKGWWSETAVRLWFSGGPDRTIPLGSAVTNEGGAMSTRESGGQQHAERRTDEVDETTSEAAASTETTERHEALSEDVDAILDEIDEVLEENAEEFVRAFVQKGGQ